MGSSAPPPELTSRILRHERALIGVALAGLAALGWWYVATRAAIDGAPAMPMAATPLGGLVVMWWLMMVAMMLPSAAPAILLYARVRQQNAPKAVTRTWVFVGGYLGVWFLFSVAAAIAQHLLTGASMALGNRTAAGAVLIAAGLYQLSPLKSACVTQCRSPAAFLSRHWRPGWTGAVRLGLLHGAYCLGCCWMLMALLFVGGVMNLLWVVGLTLIVAIEKLAPRGPLIGRAAGMALIAWGVLKLAGF
jgi:predicted metal-binding membrane protein